MQIVPPALEQLITDLSRLPGIGKKTASRLAMYILRRPASEALGLAEALVHLHSAIRLCSTCYTFSETDPCAVCGNSVRNSRLVCVVEEPADLLVIEKTGTYQGVYHVLHGVLSPMDGIGPEELKIEELIQRIQSGGVDEILLATSSTVPGEATASYLMDILQKQKVAVSRLACGIPMGMDIKYADPHTLTRAIERRVQVADLSKKTEKIKDQRMS